MVAHVYRVGTDAALPIRPEALRTTFHRVEIPASGSITQDSVFRFT